MTSQARRVSLDPSNRQPSVYDLDQFRLTNKNDKGRVLLLDEDVVSLYRHFVANPPGSDTKGRYYVCLGDYDVMVKSGQDVERCPACANAMEGRDVPVGFASRRFAMHMAQYTTNAKGEIVPPVVLQMKVWIFSENMFGKLIDRKKEHESLMGKDLVLTCFNPTYHQYDIDVSPRCVALSDEAAKESVKRLRADRFSNLDALLGTQVGFEELDETVMKALGGVRTEAAGVEVDQVSVDELFGSADGASSETETVFADESATDDDISDMVSSQMAGATQEELESLFGA